MLKNKTKTYKHNVGQNVKLWREFKGIKQEDLAQRLDIKPSTLSKIENGGSDLNTRMMEDIANALELDVLQLYSNPQQQFTFNNCPNSNNGINNGSQNVYNIDKEFLDKIINLIDKVSDKLSA